MPGMRVSGAYVSGGVFTSPTKNVPTPSPAPEMPEQEDLDTTSLLQRVKQTVEGMKQRRESVGPRVSFGIATSPSKRHGQGEGVLGGFSLLAPDVKEEVRKDNEQVDMDVDMTGNAIKDEDASDGLRDDTHVIKAIPVEAPRSLHTPTQIPKMNGSKTTTSASDASLKGLKEMYRDTTRDDDVEGGGAAPETKPSRVKSLPGKVSASTRRKNPRAGIIVDGPVGDSTPESQDNIAPKPGRRGRSASKQPESDAETGDAEPKGKLPDAVNKPTVEAIVEVRSSSFRHGVEVHFSFLQEGQIEPEQVPRKGGRSKRSKTNDEDGASGSVRGINS